MLPIALLITTLFPQQLPTLDIATSTGAGSMFIQSAVYLGTTNTLSLGLRLGSHDRLELTAKMASYQDFSLSNLEAAYRWGTLGSYLHVDVGYHRLNLSYQHSFDLGVGQPYLGAGLVAGVLLSRVEGRSGTMPYPIVGAVLVTGWDFKLSKKLLWGLRLDASLNSSVPSINLFTAVAAQARVAYALW